MALKGSAARIRGREAVSVSDTVSDTNLDTIPIGNISVNKAFKRIGDTPCKSQAASSTLLSQPPL